MPASELMSEVVSVSVHLYPEIFKIGCIFCQSLQWRKTEIENFDSQVIFKLITNYQSVSSHQAIYQLQDDSLPVILPVLPV